MGSHRGGIERVGGKGEEAGPHRGGGRGRRQAHTGEGEGGGGGLTQGWGGEGWGTGKEVGSHKCGTEGEKEGGWKRKDVYHFLACCLFVLVVVAFTAGIIVQKGIKYKLSHYKTDQIEILKP